MQVQRVRWAGGTSAPGGDDGGERLSQPASNRADLPIHGPMIHRSCAPRSRPGHCDSWKCAPTRLEDVRAAGRLWLQRSRSRDVSPAGAGASLRTCAHSMHRGPPSSRGAEEGRGARAEDSRQRREDAPCEAEQRKPACTPIIAPAARRAEARIHAPMLRILRKTPATVGGKGSAAARLLSL